MCSISSFWFLFHPSQYSDILAPFFSLSSLFFIAITPPWCHMLSGFIHSHAVDAPTVFRLNLSAPRCLRDLTMTSYFRQVLGPARLYALSWHLPSSRPLLKMRVHDSRNWPRNSLFVKFPTVPHCHPRYSSQDIVPDDRQRQTNFYASTSFRVS
ncbi:hypothetical protein BDN67DRAFT_963252 [Paxillus ammoniavirescens]|nr:hypothetical protein BDN67DRAFT_963252 [Paxillus ammoniavirescens]